MSDKDEIKELFQKELGNYEAKVDPSLWNGIQSGLSGASPTGGAASVMSVATKAVIGVVVATVATISSIVIFSTEQTNKLDKDRVEKTEYTEESTNDNSEDLTIEESDDVKRDTEEIQRKPKSSDKRISESQQNVNEEKEIVEVPEIKETKEELEPEPDSEQPVLENVENNSEPTEPSKEKEAEEKTEISKPLIADISIIKRDNQYLKFEVTGENIEKVEWYFGDGKSSNEFSPEHFYEEPGNFEVIAVIKGEKDEVIEKKLEVTIEGEGKFTKLPNTFTPNNDGVNDEFFVEHEGINDFQLNIFNKKQELIYSTDNPDFRWRGYSSKGERVDEGEYVYVIIAKDKAGNVINKYKTLTITR